MNKQFKIASILFLTLLFSLSIIPEMTAQCPMCRMAVESNLQNGGSAGRGLNMGILYMLLTPYFIIGTIAFIWWRNRKQVKEDI